jgi:hypothetical protein
VRRRAHDEWIAAEEAKEQPVDSTENAGHSSRAGQRAMRQPTAFQTFTSNRKDWLSLNRLFKYLFWLLLPTLIILIVVTV